VMLVLGAAAGCGDDDGSGGTSVSGSKLLTELTASEAGKLCSYSEKQYKAVLGSEDQYCTLDGLGGTSDSELCEEYKQECLDEGYYADDKNEDWECENEEAIVDEAEGECTATVSEYEACVQELFQGRREANKKYTCEDAADLYEDSIDGEGIGPDCTELFTKCPGVEI
jgi:hypothetical protein